MPARAPSDRVAAPPVPAPADLVAALPRPVALVGLGVEGRETLRFLRRHGVTELVVCDRALTPESAAADPDLAGVTVHGGDGWEAVLAACGTVVRSPGVRPDHPGLQAARAAGARITSATALFLGACPGPVVGVTGTLGKGTTVSLVEAALAAADRPCRTGGNIGVNPLAFLEELDPGTAVVLELSSFQLMDLAGRRPEVAVVLRTTSEHQDWHRSLAEYRAAKRGLIAPPEVPQRIVYCADSAGSIEVVGGRLPGAHAVSLCGPVSEGIGTEGPRVFRYRQGRRERREALEHLTLPGRFNLENAAAACLAAELLGADAHKSAEAIAAFAGLPHRLEPVGAVPTVHGQARCYNDSYATRPDATLGALSAFAAEPLALIAGGSEKHADFGALAEALCRHGTLRRLVLIGTTAARIADEVQRAAERLKHPAPPMARAESLEAAFTAARDALPEGGVVLFSPACASFDMFPNYKVRGERFRDLVQSAGSP